MDCLFCKINKNDCDSLCIYEDDIALDYLKAIDDAVKDAGIVSHTATLRDYYNSINKLKNGKILCFRILNNNSLKELDVLIKSINNLNYKIVSIDELIKE